MRGYSNGERLNSFGVGGGGENVHFGQDLQQSIGVGAGTIFEFGQQRIPILAVRAIVGATSDCDVIEKPNK